MDDLTFPEGTPEDFKEMVRKIRAIGQPYIDRIAAEPWNLEALNAEMQWRAEAIIFEYEVRTSLPDCDHAAYQTKSGHK
jgi:hypothetical protein